MPNPPVPALAIITVEQATAQASFRSKVQKWEISGASSIANLRATDAAGNNILFTKLVGAQEVPPQVSAGSGDVSVTLRTDAVLGQVIDYSLTYTGLTGVTQSHIHSGAVGVNGPPHVFLCSNTVGGTTPPCPAAGGTVTGTLVAANFTAGGAVTGLPRTDCRHPGRQHLRQCPYAGRPRWRDPRPARPQRGGGLMPDQRPPRRFLVSRRSRH